MTVSQDLISIDQSDEFQTAAPTYPTAFGITFTPAISAGLIAVLGLAGTLYLVLNLLMPAWEKYQQQQTTRNDKQAQIQQKQAVLQQNEKVKTELAQAKQQNAEVLSLFANEKNLGTLLLDLNKVVESGNARLQRNDVRAKLKRFVPVTNQSGDIVNDGSLGTQVNGKLKRRAVTIEFQGTFVQTQSILRNIERLQPLLIVRDYQSTSVPPAADSQGVVVRGPEIIDTSFQLQAIMPASPEEAAMAAASANQPK